MRPPAHTLRGRIGITVGCGGVFVLAVLAGIGGPPSEFRPGVPPVVDWLGDYVLEIYAAGALLALAGVVTSVIAPRAGRVTGTVAFAITAFGNLVSFAIGASGELRFGVLFLALSAPVLLLMWYHVARAREA
jgi:hypothetical protein